MSAIIDEKILSELRAIVGPENIIIDPEKLDDYSHDEFSLREIARVPEAVVLPVETRQVAAILALADSLGIPMTPRGGATGLCGGCVPVRGGIVLSLEKMNRIAVDRGNQMAVAGAGATLREFARAAEEAGLYFPPHPGDESAMIGGLVATNAGGSRAVKYGVIRNYVRGLEVVLPNGAVIRPGGKFIKSSTGYNLMHLFIGSEGTLGVITEAVLQLMAQPPVLRSLVIPFPDLESAVESVPLLLSKKIVPVAVEFVGLDVISITEEYLHKRWPTHEGTAHLLVILDAATEEEQERLSQAVAGICLEKGAIDVYIADTPAKQDEILAIRSMIYEAIKDATIEILDISVPRAEIAGHVRKVGEIAAKYDIWLPTFGHAADGNVHTHLMKARFVDGRIVPLAESEWRGKIDAVRNDLYKDAHERGGVISGEHGIGLVKKPFLPIALDAEQIRIMKGIKALFDPNGILNPGKIFD
jgi:glycolate oxidase